MNTTAMREELDTDLKLSVELEEKIYALLGESQEAWDLVTELARANFRIGQLWARGVRGI